MKRSICSYLLSLVFSFSVLFLFFSFLKPIVVWAVECEDNGGAPCSLCGGDNCSLCWCGYYWEVSCGGCGGVGGCFTSDTKIATPSGETEIEKLKEGDVVKSFDPETGEVKEATVEAVHKRQVSSYYILKTESGREIKVTGEHPILAIKQGKVGKVEKVGKEIISFFEGVWEKVKGVVR